LFAGCSSWIGGSPEMLKSVREITMNQSARRIAQASAIAASLFAAIATQGHAQDAAPTQPAGLVIEARIAAKVSTKNAKVGDAVAAKTLREYKLQDGTDIPKGSKIDGKLDSVQSKKAGNGDSLMSFRFDSIEVKGGATVPVHALVVAIGPSLAPKDSLGGNSVLGRNTNPQPGTGVTAASQGRGSSSGLDPNAGLGSAGNKDEYNIPMGSTLEGVSLGRHLDADWTTLLKGLHSEVDLDSDVYLKVELK
jgi:hypothetical protein